MALAAVAVLCSLGTSPLAAQNQNQQPGRGNFDPAQARQRMMERYKEQLDVKNDDAEWKVISERITKVMEARREVGGGGMGGFGRGGRGPGGPGGPGGDQGAATTRQC